MQGDPVLRLSLFRTLRPGFDGSLRDVVLPRMQQLPGVLGVWAGRQGPDEIGPRLVASVWTSGEDMDAAVGGMSLADEPDERLAETRDRQLEVVTIVTRDQSAAPLATGILRLARGVVANGDLRSYGATLLGDLRALREIGSDPHAFILAGIDDRSFVMITTWSDWPAIEQATGATVAEPLRTKRLAGLGGFRAEHFELFADLRSGAHPKHP